MNTRKLAIWITFLAVFAMAARVSVDTDTWWHLRAGEWMVENGAIIKFDQFSYTRAGEPWNYPGWLAEVPMYLIYRYLGPGGLNLWTAIVVTLAFIFVWNTLSGGSFLRAFVIILAATVSGVYWAARPYIITFVLSAITLWILERHRNKESLNSGVDSKSELWWLALIMIVWVNSHGGFVIGFILWGIYWLSDSSKRIGKLIESRQSILSASLWKSPLTLVGVAMFFAVWANPSGFAMMAYPFKTVGIGVLQEYIQEWQSPDFHSLSVQPFAWLLLLVIAAVGFSKRRLAFIDFVLVAGFAYLGFMAGRNIALFALVAPMVITRHLEPIIVEISQRTGIKTTPVRSPRGSLRYINVAILVLILMAVILKVSLIFPEDANEKAFTSTLPTQAVNYLISTKPPGKMFNSYNWGGYLIWALREYPVFTDGRTDLYNDEILGQWLQVARAEYGWQSVLEDWDVNFVFVERDLPITRALETGGWQEVYRDEKAVIFRR